MYYCFGCEKPQNDESGGEITGQIAVCQDCQDLAKTEQEQEQATIKAKNLFPKLRNHKNLVVEHDREGGNVYCARIVNEENAPEHCGEANYYLKDGD